MRFIKDNILYLVALPIAVFLFLVFSSFSSPKTKQSQREHTRKRFSYHRPFNQNKAEDRRHKKLQEQIQKIKKLKETYEDSYSNNHDANEVFYQEEESRTQVTQNEQTNVPQEESSQNEDEMSDPKESNTTVASEQLQSKPEPVDLAHKDVTKNDKTLASSGFNSLISQNKTSSFADEKNNEANQGFINNGAANHEPVTKSRAREDEKEVANLESSFLDNLLKKGRYADFENEVKNNTDTRFKIEAYSALLSHLFTLEGPAFIEANSFLQSLFANNQSAHIISQSISIFRKAHLPKEAVDYSLQIITQLVSKWPENENAAGFKAIYVDIVAQTLPREQDFENETLYLDGFIDAKYARLNQSNLEISSL